MKCERIHTAAQSLFKYEKKIVDCRLCVDAASEINKHLDRSEDFSHFYWLFFLLHQDESQREKCEMFFAQISNNNREKVSLLSTTLKALLYWIKRIMLDQSSANSVATVVTIRINKTQANIEFHSTFFIFFFRDIINWIEMTCIICWLNAATSLLLLCV